MSSAITCIIGLGNPGAEYEDTRHNAGAWFLQNLAQAQGVELRPMKKFHGLYAKMQLDQHACHLLLPTAFMNCSGQSVQALMRFYKIQAQNILVAHDELDMPTGVAKLKMGGGHGGHNGLRDIIKSIDTNNFLRLRLGIGHPGNSKLVHDYVLHRPSKSDKEKIVKAIDDAMFQIPHLLTGDIDKATRQLHAPSTPSNGG